MTGARCTLWAVPASHPCAAVARALELKRIPYERIDLVPVLHKPVSKLRFGGSGTVPGLVLADGRRVLGSRPIMRALDELAPDPPLLPSDADRRADVLRAEAWGDELLQALVRRVLWFALSERPEAQASYVAGARLRPPTPAPLVRASAGAVAKLERRFNGSTIPAVRADLLHLPNHLDRIDRWLDQGVLDADATPSAADLQIASGLRLALTLADLAPIIDARPAGAFARRVFSAYPGATPAGALPAAWLHAG